LFSVSGQEPAEPPAASETPHSRVVKYADRDVVPVNAKIRYTTLIILPKDERILDFTCGDKDYWIVDGNENFAFVKPATAGSATNVNLVTAAGNVYSFVLTEVSEIGAEPDLKVFIEPTEASVLSAAAGEPRFGPSSQIEDYRQQIELAKTEAWQAREQAQQLIDKQVSEFRSSYPSALQFAYKFRRGRKPFFVDAIYHDGRFTYIKASPAETPGLYELKDGKPNLVNFDYQDGAFVVPKVLENGYLAIGKQRLRFVLAN
jgi:type IV secretion system protein VirB9